MKTTFKLTQNHIKLLQRMYVGWQNCETGAPEIDPKRPYGNSWVAGDVYEIIHGKCPQGGLEDDEEDEYLKLHEETADALQIVLVTKSFTPGKYVRDNPYNHRDWRLVEE